MAALVRSLFIPRSKSRSGAPLAVERSRVSAVPGIRIRAAVIGQSLVRTNKPLTLDGSSSTRQRPTIRQWEWDLDGDGQYEITSATPTTTQTLTQLGVRRAHLRVADMTGASNTTTFTIQVTRDGDGYLTLRTTAPQSPTKTNPTATVPATPAIQTPQGNHAEAAQRTDRPTTQRWRNQQSWGRS